MGKEGSFHSYSQCDWHYSTFDTVPGGARYRKIMNEILADYQDGYELSESGEILSRGDIRYGSPHRCPYESQQCYGIDR